jgi:hypothetical protein
MFLLLVSFFAYFVGPGAVKFAGHAVAHFTAIPASFAALVYEHSAGGLATVNSRVDTCTTADSNTASLFSIRPERQPSSAVFYVARQNYENFLHCPKNRGGSGLRPSPTGRKIGHSPMGRIFQSFSPEGPEKKFTSLI